MTLEKKINKFISKENKNYKKGIIMNKLYFGDNLEIRKDLLKQNPNGFIDLIYIDPPFNSKRNYNVLYESMDMEDLEQEIKM